MCVSTYICLHTYVYIHAFFITVSGCTVISIGIGCRAMAQKSNVPHDKQTSLQTRLQTCGSIRCTQTFVVAILKEVANGSPVPGRL